MKNQDNSPDVLIIGGGPAGTTCGTFLARKGHRVVLLEKNKHPKFHIGESLLPMNLPIFEALGVARQVEEMGVVKLGADFTYGEKSIDYHTYRFDRALGGSPPSAFEVKRDEFDQLLFDNCKESGVEAFEQTTVTEVELNNGHPLVTSRSKEGENKQWNPRMLIDASGRDAFMAGSKGWKEKNQKYASAAIFGHFKGIDRRPGADQGNISVYWHQNGWMWMIPLRDDVTSVGVVCWPDYLKTRTVDISEFLQNTIDSCPAASSRMRNATLNSPVRVAANYSYSSKNCWSDGFMSIGDAYTFIDPVFSSGVYLAMNGAQRSLAPIEKWLSGDTAGFRRDCKAYVKTTDLGLRRFSWFIYRFTTPAMRNLFQNPRNIFKVEDAVISMLSGDVFDNKQVHRRLIIFKVIYFVSWLVSLKESFVYRRRRLRAVHIPVDFGSEAE